MSYLNILEACKTDESMHSIQKKIFDNEKLGSHSTLAFTTFVEQPSDITQKLLFTPPRLSPGEFGISKERLFEICSFENRNEPFQLPLLNSKEYGGVEGIAYFLRTNLKTGLKNKPKKKSSDGKWESEGSLLLATQMEMEKRFQADGGSSASWWLFGKKVKEDEGIVGILKGEVIDSKLRIDNFGRNYIPIPKTKSIPRLIFDSVKEDLILKILIVGALIALTVGLIGNPQTGWIDSIAILIAVVIVSSVTATNNYTNEKKFKKLLLLQSSIRVKVIRDHIIDEISSWDLLVGDIVALNTGDEIPADGLYVRGEKMKVDESPLTGECKPVSKTANSPFMFSGCQVSEGVGFMLVTGSGINSTSGKIQQKLSERQNETTPLQDRLAILAKQIGFIGLISSALTFFALFINWGVYMKNRDQSIPLEVDKEVYKILQYIVVSVTILVVAIPEGLPISVTISLGFSMFEMMKENCFVRQLQSSETMGAATCICTDKTGTITENRMTVVKCIFGDRIYNGEGSGEVTSREFHPQTLTEELTSVLCECISANTTCFLKRMENSAPTFVGSATEGALLVFIEKLGCNYEEEREYICRVENGTWQFDSSSKVMSTLIGKSDIFTPQSKLMGVENRLTKNDFDDDDQEDEDMYTLHVKGAPETIINGSTSFLDRSGHRALEMTPDDKSRFNHVVKLWASEGLRTIAISYRNTSTHPLDENSVFPRPEHDLCLVGILGIKDPIRKNAAEAVKECQTAGLSVRMVTGDNLLTASKIAQEVGILKAGGIAIDGKRFRALSKEEKIKLLPHLQVLARSTPQDKYELVCLLKELGEVVAVTGDGTNDAPALKEADGISGTQVAVNASDIVLLDDNFISLVAAIKWGRNVLNSVRKFLQFQLSVNFTAVLVTIISSAVTGTPAIDSVSLLWINLIMDSLGALALASDKPDKNILLQLPHKRKHSDAILTKNMMISIFLQVVFQVTALVLIEYYFADKYIYLLHPFITEQQRVPETKAITVTTFVLMQIASQISSRQLKMEINVFKGLFRNRIFVIVQCTIIIIQVLAVQFGYIFFDFLPMNGLEWGFCFFIMGLNLVYTIFVRVIIMLLRRRTRRQKIKKNKKKVDIEKLKYGSF